MDERHWWIAGKVEETLHLGGENDVSTALETFFLQSETLQVINSFLQADGIHTLFIIVEIKERTKPKWKLHLQSDLQSLENVLKRTPFPIVLYFLRPETTNAVDAATMEREIFCGEIKANPVQSLKSLLNEFCIPILRAQKNWGSCSQESVTHFLSGLEKYVAAIEDAANMVHSEKHQILRRPENVLNPDFVQQRSAVIDPDIVEEYETLVCEWMKTIEQILMEAGDERVHDIASTPLTELERWHRRQKILGFLTEQLRGTDCKAVIGLLISAKSRLLKKWKAVDISITDAATITKDRVKYLEALYRHLDSLATEHDSAILMNNVLPAFFNAVRQMETMSRFFSRNGYLGLLLTKVSNQLARNCQAVLQKSLFVSESEDKLWDKVKEYVMAGEGELMSLADSKAGNNTKKEKHKVEMLKNKSPLREQFRACMALLSNFQDALSQLRDWLWGTHGMHQYSDTSSISSTPGRLSSTHMMKTNKTSTRKLQSVASSYDQHNDYQSTGVAITDDETILYHMEVLCAKLKQMDDIMEKLHEFKILSEHTVGLRKPSQEVLIEDDDSESESVCDVTVLGDPKETVLFDINNGSTTHKAEMVRQNMSSSGKLQPLIEEDEAKVSLGDSLESLDLPGKYKDIINPNDDPSFFQSEEQELDKEDNELMLSSEEKHMLANLYSDEDADDEETTLSSILMNKLQQMLGMLRQYIDTEALLDTERRDNNPCEEGYSEFLVMNQQAEKYISVYIQALFLRKMPTKEALSILQRFSVVNHRQGIKHILNECYFVAFDWFYEELKDVQQVYETFKDEPVLPRNMPPAVGAIMWSKKLLSNIEESVKVFRNVRIITMCLAYSQTIKLYNRIASTLLKYEELWYQKWRSQVDKHLSGFNYKLLVRDPVTQQLKVNTDLRIIHLIDETKWMLRLGIDVPEAALVAFQQAEKFKVYKSDLQDMVQKYEKLEKKIPQSFASLFKPHLDRVNHHFQPALSTLSWSSVNIEGLLHKANSAVKRLQDSYDKVTEINKNVIEKNLEEIYSLDILPVDEIAHAPKSPEEFLQLVKCTLLEMKMELEAKASVINSAFSDIIKTLKSFMEPTEENNETLSSGKNVKLTSYSWIQKSSRKLQPISTDTEKSSNVYPEETINKVLGLLSNSFYEAVYTCIFRSLIIFAQLTGCDMECLSNKSSELFSQTNKDAKEETDCSAFIKRNSLASVMDLLSRSNTGTKRLRFRLMLAFKIPRIMIDPPIEIAQDALQQAVTSILSIGDSLTWWSGEKRGQSFHASLTKDELLRQVANNILKVVNDMKPEVTKQVFGLRCYDFLWSDDMCRQSREFLDGNPGLVTIQKEVKRFVDLEQKLTECPEVLELGCISLDFSLLKETLKGFAGSWKSHYATILHQQAKKTLLNVVQYRENVWQQLTMPVQSLEQLNSCVTLLEEVQDMENKIDDVYRPIEIMYGHLRSFQLRIPREEVTEVINLRSKWTELLNLTYVVKETLLKEKEDIFKQELDKQVKSFVVEVIQFRNSFDTRGPAAPGVKPEEAVARLHDFKEKYQVYDAKRNTLNSVQRLFNAVPKAFPELDRTGKDLQLLGTLYILFQKFLDFDLKFQSTLWAEVDLSKCNKEIEQYWSECLIWNDKLKDWDAYNEMAREVKFYVDIFPLLHDLKSKEIRNRHWLQVMSVTGSSFPLEANVLKVSHILDIELLKFQTELVSIAKAAKKEMDFEIKMRQVEEEWSEQVFNFMPSKNRAVVLLEKEDNLKLLEELENAQILLAQMLTSKEIEPLREEATTWAEKLKHVGEVLELWLEVQDLWQNLEEVFSYSAIIEVIM